MPDKFIDRRCDKKYISFTSTFCKEVLRPGIADKPSELLKLALLKHYGLCFGFSAIHSPKTPTCSLNLNFIYYFILLLRSNNIVLLPWMEVDLLLYAIKNEDKGYCCRKHRVNPGIFYAGEGNIKDS
ncbi:hypothetical protein [Fonticella tunisiensis]|uniref:hypothetical protein n=1 Tax=Fonticella tunisiensis TaxID=1096341 RepID=UPI00105E81CA|nr:hypothetical protein [Fonticella tunisiensis]